MYHPFLARFLLRDCGGKDLFGLRQVSNFQKRLNNIVPCQYFRCLTLVRPYFFRENSIFHICQYKDDCAKVFLVQRSNALDSIIGSLPQERSREFSPRFEEKNIFITSSNICLNLLFESLYPKKTLRN